MEKIKEPSAELEPRVFKKQLKVYLDKIAQEKSAMKKGRKKVVYKATRGPGYKGKEIQILNTAYFSVPNLLTMNIYRYVSEIYPKDPIGFRSQMQVLVQPAKQADDNPFLLCLKYFRDLKTKGSSDSTLSRDSRWMSLAYNSQIEPIFLLAYLKMMGGPAFASKLFNESPRLHFPGTRVRTKHYLTAITGS